MKVLATPNNRCPTIGGCTDDSGKRAFGVNTLMGCGRRPESRRWAQPVTLALVALLFCNDSTQAQSPQAVPHPELAKENQSRVAASASEIKTVLLKDAGLKVELKRSIAADASSHGQIVSDAELSDEAIFERLETDILFRSVATSLLQKYGYLLPKLNPASDLAKERDLLMQERAKRFAQIQAEELMQLRQGTGQNRQSDSSCDTSCMNSQTQPSQTRGGGQRGTNASQVAPLGAGPSGAQSTERIGTVGSADGTSAANGGNPRVIQGATDLNLNVSNGVEISPSSNTSSLVPQGANHGKGTLDPVQMVRRPGPYADIPSLYDRYIQSVARPTTPKRFGMEVFENETAGTQTLPMDLPAGPDYVVGPGDGLAFDLWGGVSQRLYRTVDREGRVSLPEVGPILISGKSLEEVQQNVQQILRSQFRDVSADVSLSRLRTIRVYEVGDVMNAGAYDISSLSTPLNALFAAGGPTQRGSLRIVKHYRGDKLVEVVDVYDLLLRGVKTNLQRLENGDTVLVPPIGPQVTVEGMVRRPAIYELKDEKTLASALELAGGILPTAALRHIEVQRIVAHNRQTMLSLEIPETDSDSEVAKKLEAFEIHDGDMIRIYPIAPYNQDVVYVEGHVLRQGRYSYHDGMRVTDVISSYDDLLPEPAGSYAEIVRLNTPDFRPSMESFSLADALANPAQAPVLHRLDTVRIFSRFDFEDEPTVSVLGEVRTPGTFRTQGQLRLVDAIHLGGGLTPDSQTTDAQVFRYVADGKFKILNVHLRQALEGDSIENIVLQPRDRVLIHRNPDAVAPPTVTIRGEVAKPGRYPLTTKMRVSELIRIAGGLKPGADAQIADLTDFQWTPTTELSAQNQSIAISSALTGDPLADVPLHNGDVLTIRQLPGWNDLGASITVRGEVTHPGSYGIRPGERLSSILERAGGLELDAYPYGAILQRTQVRELETRAQETMILRVRNSQSVLELLPETDEKQKQAKELALQQVQSSLELLGANLPVGRVTIRITGSMDRWKNTAVDIEVRAGDTLIIPKRPSYVVVSGQVFNPIAVSYRPGMSASWYLGQSGGPTQLGDKRAVFVIRADGTVIGSRRGLWSGDSLSSALLPGDTVVVPERAFGGGVQWQNVFLAAQVASSVASAVVLALHF
jgi:protein involved in polysaccharide export with SLBB domain